MSDNLPDISFKLTYFEARPFSLEVRNFENYSKWVFYESDLETIRSLYWILRVFPRQLRKYLIARLARNYEGSSHIKKPLKNLIHRLNDLVVSETPVLPSGESEDAIFYLSSSVLPTVHARLMTLEYLIDTLRYELSDLLTRSYFFIDKIQIQNRLNSFTNFCKYAAWALFIYLRFFNDLILYSNKRFIDSYSELEQQQLGFIKEQFIREFKIFDLCDIPICE
jgi:hypothetical protein